MSGEFITLLNCRKVRQSSMAAYEASFVFVSKSRRWFASMEDIAFDTLTLRYTGLEAWMNVSGISKPAPEDYDAFW